METEELEYDDAYNLSLEDLELVHSIISEQLDKNGYKKISDAEFKEKLDLIFHISPKIKMQRL